MTRSGLDVAFRVSNRDTPTELRIVATEARRPVRRVEVPAHEAVLCEVIASWR